MSCINFPFYFFLVTPIIPQIITLEFSRIASKNSFLYLIYLFESNERKLLHSILKVEILFYAKMFKLWNLIVLKIYFYKCVINEKCVHYLLEKFKASLAIFENALFRLSIF